MSGIYDYLFPEIKIYELCSLAGLYLFIINKWSSHSLEIKRMKNGKLEWGIEPMTLGSAPLLSVLFKVCHEETDLKVFVVVMPEEGLAGWGPSNPSFGMTLTIKYYSTACTDYIL